MGTIGPSQSASPMKVDPASDAIIPSAHVRVADEAVQLELLRSEQQRVMMLMALLALILLVISTTRTFPQLLHESLRPRVLPVMSRVTLLTAGYFIYELAVYFWLGRLRRAKRVPPSAFRYANVFIEVSLPTVAMLVGSAFLDRIEVLVGVPPLLYFLFISLSALNLDFRLCAFAGVVAGAEFIAVSLHLLNAEPAPGNAGSPVHSLVTSPHQYMIKTLILLVAGLCAGFVAHQIRKQLTRALEAMDQRERAISIFGQHVSPQVAGLLLNQPMDFDGQSRNVCVMFLDIRDFSRLAGERSAPDVMAYLNTLFGSMIPVINEHHGIVNKFLGDGFMAVFGAPLDDDEHCRHAISASQEILRRVDTLNAEGSIPHTRIGIGLHTGPVMTGNVGTAERKEYTIIGDSVNLASRVEQATKQLSARLLVSEAVAETLWGADGVSMEDMGPIELKGQAKPVRLFKVA